jgi:DNA-binding SARP family transcriptional activator/tetratricopeptide (TPR) repeat protein
MRAHPHPRREERAPLSLPGQIVVRLRLIGQMEAWTVTSENVLPAGRKTRALLAAIALSGPRPALRGRLAELLWSRRPEEQARASLRQEIHRLLEVLAPAQTDILQVTRDHLSLTPGAVWIDVEEVMRATTDNPSSLSLLDGELLEDLTGIDPTFDMWLTAGRERLRDRARGVAEALLRDQDRPETTIPAAHRLLQIDRAHEGAWRALMRAHAEQGERGMAIQAYDRCRAVLADLLDAAPSAETQKLLTEIRGPGSNRVAVRPAAQMPQPLLPEPARLDDETFVETHQKDERQSRGGAHIGVLPMLCVGLSEEDAYLGPGLADEITTALSRFRWMFVVSSSSLTRFAQGNRDESAIRRAFGIDFLLDGTVQRNRNKLRITLRLLDLNAGNQVVWARRFDRLADDLLSVQDEIAAEVVAQIDPEILLIEAKRSAARPRIDATAYDLVLRSIPLLSRLERESFQQAGEYLAQALALEPDYAAAHAWYAYWHAFLVGQDWAENPSEILARGGELAERAIVLDPFDARALTIAGHVRAFLHHSLREAAALHDRALELNPNLAMAWALSAMTCAYLGDTAEAERRGARYKALSPLDPHAFFFDGLFAMVHLMKHDYEAAAAAGRAVTQIGPAYSGAYKPYIAALGYLGRDQEAATALRRLLAIEPDFTIERFLAKTPLEGTTDRAHYAEGLRRAGAS